MKKYNDTYGLIQMMQSKEEALSIKNSTNYHICTEEPPFFLSWADIDKDLDIQSDMTEREKAIRIHNVVDKYHSHSSPIYESFEQHSPFYFFSVYGTGFCDDAAQNISLIAKRAGLESKVEWLSGHVVSAIFHDDDWRIYDADALKIIEVEGNTASLSQMENLGKHEKLRTYNQNYATFENNRMKDILERKPAPLDKISIEMFPYESRQYFDNYWQISHSGSYLDSIKCPQSIVKRAHGVVGNFVRRIPISSLDNYDTAVLKDFFPLSGVIIRVPTSNDNIVPSNLPHIILDSHKLPGKIKLEAIELETKNNDSYRYFDLSHGVRTLENLPSFEVSLTDLKGIQKMQGAEIIAIHYYCYANAKFKDQDESTFDPIYDHTLEVKFGD